MSNETVSSFYADHPWLGVRFDRQILPWKDNTSALSPLVSSAFVTANPLNSTQDFLSYLATGSASKRYRFRTGYDQHNARYAVQINVGTDTVQDWRDYLTIDEATGAVVGDFSSFYPVITVRETNGVPTFQTNKITFHSSDFYITPDSSGNPIISFAGSSGGSGEVNTASNIGAGTGLFAQKVIADLQFKSLLAGANISITNDADEVSIAASVPPQFYLNVGLDNGLSLYKSINTIKFDDTDFYISQNAPNTDEVHVALRPDRIANIGSGSGVFAQKSGKEFQFKKLSAGENVIISDDGSTLTVSSPDKFYLTVKESDDSPAYKNISLINFDSNDFYVHQNTPNTDSVTISSRRGVSAVTTASNLGAGAGLFAQKIVDDLQFKSLTEGPGIRFNVDANEVRIDSTVEQFYGLNVKETDGSPSYSNIKTISFDSEHFYVGQNSPNTDEAIVSFRGSSSGGEANTASNIGAGTGLFAQKSLVDLQFKSLLAGSNIEITSDADELTIAAKDQRFYLTIKESDGGPAYKNISLINFDSQYFYISQNTPNIDETLISFRPFWPPPTLYSQNTVDQTISGGFVRTDLTLLTGLTLPTTVAVNTKKFRVNGLVAIHNTSASSGTFFLELYNGVNGNSGDTQVKNFVCSLPAGGQLTLPIGPFEFTPTDSTFTKVGLVANFERASTVFGLAPNTSTIFVELVP